METLSFEQMEKIEGGKFACTMATIGLVAGTIGIYTAPFTGGISLGLVAMAGFVSAAYGYGSACRG